LRLFSPICAAVLLLLSLPARAESVPAQHARVELISDKQSIKPGQDFSLGVHYVLEPGWHIYWINPGDSGQPPSFQWQLPSGLQAEQIKWPAPERLSGPQLVDYGYKDQALFIIPIHTSTEAGSNTPVAITLNAKWLICREVCIPERAQLEIALPISAKANDDPTSAKIFAETQKLLPSRLPRGWNVTARSTHDDFVLNIAAGKRIMNVEFFPLDPGQIDNPAPQKIQAMPAGAKITLKKSDILLKPITILRGLLTIPGGPAYRIEAPVRQPIQ